MANPHSDPQQRIAPSTEYNVPGSPDQYRFVLRGADLVLIDQHENEQVFLFVGNIMSLDGSVRMTFGDGQTLDSQDLFSRSDMEDMQQFDNESTEWEVQGEFDANASPDNQGNTIDGTGLLPPAEQDKDIPAQAEGGAPEDPTDELLKLQRNLITKMSEKSGEGGELSTPIGMESSGSAPQADDAAGGQQVVEQVGQEEDGPTEYNGDNNPDVDTPTIELTAATDSGLQDDYTTNNQHPTFEGTATPDCTVEIYIDNVLTETVTADGDGNFSSTATYNLNGGSYLLHAVAVFSGGETFQSTVHELTIDLDAPTLPSLELSASSDTGTVSDGNYYTSDTTPSLSGTGGDPDSTVTLYVSTDGITYTELGTVDVGSDGAWGYTLTGAQALADGEYIFRLSSTDLAGNPATGYTYLTDVNVKTSNPTSTLDLSAGSDSMDADAGGTPGDLLTNAATLDLVATASADTARVEIFLVGSGSYVSLGQAVKSGGSWVFTVDNADIPTDGDYRFVAQATDVAGNVEVIQSKFGLEVEIDRTPVATAPTMDLDAGSDSTDTAGLLGTDSDDHTNANSLTINGTAGANQPIDLYLSVDGGADVLISDGVITSDALGNWTYTFDASGYGLSGTESLAFTAQVLDAAANVSETTLTVDVDHTLPDIPTIGLDNLQGTLETDILENTATVRNTNAVLQGLVTESSADLILTVYAVNGGTRTAIANNMPGNGALGDVTVSDNGDGTYTWSYDYGAIADGQSYTFVVTAEDAAGNFSSRDSKTLVIHADTSISAPAITLDASTDTEGGPSGAVGDDYTGYVGGNPANALKLNVSGDDNSTITVYLLDGSAPGASAIVVNGMTIGTGVLVGTSVQDVNDDWPLVSFDASSYAGTETSLTFAAVAEDKAGNTDHTTYTLTLDDVDPTGGAIDLDAADDLGVSDTDNVTSANSMTLRGSLTEDGADVKVTVYDNNVEVGQATVASDGMGGYEWTYLVAGADAAEGAHSYTVRIEDNAGNTTDIAALPVTVDRSISTPTFDLTSDTGRETADNVTNAGDLTFSGTSDVGDTVTVYRGATAIGTFVAASANWTYTVAQADAPEGIFEYSISTSDTAGNTASSTPVEVTVDRSVNTPGDIDLASASDSAYSDGGFTAGTTDSDDITNAATLTITGQVEAGGVEPDSVVYLYIQGVVDPVGSVTAGALGTTWSISVANADVPTDGDYDFYVKYVDLAGNESGPSTDLTVTIDRTGPADPAISLDGVLGTDFFVHGGNTYTSDTDPTFTLSNLETGTVLNIKVDGVSVATPTVTGAIMAFDPADFAADGTDDGAHTITVVAVDQAGNASNVAECAFILDTSAEAISGVRLTPASDTGDSDSDGITYDTTPTIQGVAEAGSTVEVVLRDGGGAVFTDTVTADGSGNWQVSVTDGSLLADGTTYDVDVTATDHAGNSATDGSYSFTLDTSIDEVGFAMVETSANDTGFAADDQYTRNPNPQFTWTAQEDLAVTISIYDDGNNLVHAYTENSPAGVNTWTVPGGDPLPDGDYTVRATFTDTAGNTVLTDGGGNPVTEEVSLTVDTAAPPLSVELADASDSGADNDWLTNNEMVAAGLELTGTSETGSRIYVYVNDMVNPVQHGGLDYLTVDATGNWTFDLSALDIGSGINNGDNSIKVVAVDQAGNNTTFTETLEVDSEVVPVGSILLDDASDSGYKGDFITNDTTPTLTGTTEGLATVVLTVSLAGVDTAVGTATADADGNWSIEVPAGLLSTDGSYTFTATISDTADNTAVTTRTITIDTDPMAPTIAMDADTMGLFNGTATDFITSDTTPEFTVTTEVGTTLRIYRDGTLVHTVDGADNDATGILTYAPAALAEGSYTYRFECEDSAGNTSETTQVVEIDPQYDPADLSVTLHADYDTGSSDADGLTNETRPVFSGTAEAGSKVRVYFSDKYDTEAAAQASAVGADYETELTLASNQTTWEYSPAMLTQDGFYKVTVVSEDEAGNQQTTTTVMELDTTPPAVPTFELTADGGNTIISTTQTTDNTPGFAGTAEAGSTVSITIKAFGSNDAVLVAEATADGSGNWFYQVENAESLADGSYNVVITGTDEAGNVAEGTAGFLITGDTPVAPTISLDSADDSNIDTDGVTNVNTALTLAGVAQSYSDVELYITTAGDTTRTAGALVTTVEAGSNGVWSADLAGTLADGTYYYYAKSEYSPGNEYVSALYELTVDTNTLTPTLTLVDDTGVADEWLDPAPNNTDSDWETSDATITGVVDEGATVVITATNTTTLAVTTVTINPENLTLVGGDWTYSHDLSGLGDGEFDIQVTTTDLAGNTASSGAQTMTFDSQTTQPTIELPVAQETALSIGGGGEILLGNGNPAGPALESHLPGDFVSTLADGYTQNNDLHLSGTAEPGSLVCITILKDSEEFSTAPIFVSPSPSGEWVYDTGVLDDGMYTFEVTSIDMAGNELSADPLNVYVDAVATRSAYIALHDDIEDTNDTNDTTPTFTLYGDGDSIWMLYLDSQADPIATGTFNSGYYTHITPGVTAGVDALATDVEHTLTMVTVDRAGNVAVSNNFTFEIDTIAPEQQADPISVTGVSTVVPASGGDPVEFYTSDNDPTITIKVEAGTQARMVGFGSDEWVEDEDNDGLITFTVPSGSIVGDGLHAVTVEFQDNVGNHDAAENLEFHLVVDTSDPSTTIDLDQASDLGFSNTDDVTSGDLLTLTGTILEQGLGQDGGDFTTDIDDYSITVTNNTTAHSQTFNSGDITLNGDGTWELTFGVDGTPLDSGDYTATVTASDLAGNQDTSTINFTVDNDDANILQDPAPALQQIGSSGYYIFQQADYLPNDADVSHYRYEMTYYGQDGDGNDISLSLGERSFDANGGIEELVTPTLVSTYDYVGIKVIDYAGNESEAVFTDIDTGDVQFSAEIETASTVASMEVGIYQDTDSDGVGDLLIDTDVVGVDGDGNWSWDFAGTLGDGDYTLHFEGLDSGGISVSAGVESTYDFSVLASEMASDEQDYSAGEADMGDGGAGGGGGGDTVQIDATVDVDHVEGSIA